MASTVRISVALLFLISSLGVFHCTGPSAPTKHPHTQTTVTAPASTTGAEATSAATSATSEVPTAGSTSAESLAPTVTAPIGTTTAPTVPRPKGKYPGSATITDVAVVSGSVTPDDIKKQLIAQRDVLVACYEDALEKGPKHSIGGDVHLEIDTDDSGQVTSAIRTKGSLVDQSGLHDCILTLARGWKLSGGKMQVRARANFYLVRR